MTAAAHSGAAALPVRPGERRWTEAELAKVRDELSAEAAELRADIERAESDIASRLGDAVGAAMPAVAVEDDADMARHRLRIHLQQQALLVEAVEKTQKR